MTQPMVVFTPGHFFRIHDDIIDVHAPTLGAIGVAIYTVLAKHMNRKTGQCYPSIGLIAKTLKLGHSTVKAYLRKIEKVAALIESTPQRDPEHGDPTSNLYTLLDLAPEAIAQRQEQRPWRWWLTALVATAAEGGGSGADLPPGSPANLPVGQELAPNQTPLLENKKKGIRKTVLALRAKGRKPRNRLPPQPRSHPSLTGPMTL
jgi:hypothetical protein